LFSPVHVLLLKYVTGIEVRITFSGNGLQLSDTSYAQLLATNSSLHYVKCVDVYPHQEPDVLLAIGQANGKVVLTTFGPSAFDCLGLAGKELGMYFENLLLKQGCYFISI